MTPHARCGWLLALAAGALCASAAADETNQQVIAISGVRAHTLCRDHAGHKLIGVVPPTTVTRGVVEVDGMIKVDENCYLFRDEISTPDLRRCTVAGTPAPPDSKGTRGCPSPH